MGEARFQRVRWIHCGVESLAAIDHSDRARRNVRDHERLLCERSGCGLDARQQMVRVADQRRISRRSRLGLCSRVVVRQMGPQRRRVGDVPRLRSVDLAAAGGASARRIEIVSPVAARIAYNVDLLLLQYFHQARDRRTQRI